MGSLALKREAFETNQIVGKPPEIVLMRNEGEFAQAQGPSEHCNLFEPESRVIGPSLPCLIPLTVSSHTFWFLKDATLYDYDDKVRGYVITALKNPTITTAEDHTRVCVRRVVKT